MRTEVSLGHLSLWGPVPLTVEAATDGSRGIRNLHLYEQQPLVRNPFP
jgi:hypothetical protein